MAHIAEAAPSLPTRLTDSLLDPINRLYRYRVARFLLKWVKRTRITPNAITVLHTGVGVSAAVMIYREYYLTAVCLFELRTVLDCLDGLLAREKHQNTAIGRTLDTIGDGISFNALMAAGALRLILDFRNYNPFLITLGVFCFAFVVAHCGTVYQLMRRKLGSIIHKEVDSVEMEWREYYEKSKLAESSLLSRLGFWIDSNTIRFVSKEWYRKVRGRKDAEHWRERAISEASLMNELACITRKKEFKRAVKATAFVSDDNVVSLMSFIFLILSPFPQQIFPYVHPVLVAFAAGFAYAVLALGLGLHFLHGFLHGVHRE